jgi:hypothetical protein
MGRFKNRDTIEDVKIMTDMTITQSQGDANLWLYPNGDLSGCTEWDNSVGSGENYLNVDEDRLLPDDDATYVCWNKPANVKDIYTMENHTTETGTINYVRVFVRVKSVNYPQHQDSLFKIMMNEDGLCGGFQDSDELMLSTTYKNFYKDYKESYPGIPWTWTKIDSMVVGFQGSSLTDSQPVTSIFRPNAQGDFTQWSLSGCLFNYQCVDDIIPDDASTFVMSRETSGERDCYHIPNHTTESGTISKVVLHARCNNAGNNQSFKDMKLFLRISNTNYDSSLISVENVWENYSYTWIENPHTNNAWTWNDIDSLQIGIWGEGISISKGMRCTQIYLVVHHTEDVNPEIRVTQLYTRVNYNRGTVTCNLHKPKDVETEHSRIINMINFWNGEREVYDIRRSGKTMLMRGTEYEPHIGSDPCARIECIRDMGLCGNDIEITDSGLLCFNGTFKIRSFGWELIQKHPLTYDWILELEDATK